MENTAAKVIITGQVQGVGFRSWVEGNAKRLDLNGWVRNRKDGSVEALFKGEKSSVVAMISLCEEGPPAARVEKVSVDNAEGIVEDGFTQKPTV